MKKIAVLSFILLVSFGSVFSAEPLRKPFVELFIEGRYVPDGSEIDVNKGQQFNLVTQAKGGRADFVHFPDTYADLGADAKIISRGYNKLIYEKNGVVHKWEMLDEKIDLESDTKIKLSVNSELINKHQTEVFIPVDKVEKTYIKVKVSTYWKYDNGTTTTTETDVAEATIYLHIQGNTNEWFATPNVKAAGNRDQVVEEKLHAIQDSYNKIESLLNNFEFTSIQPEIHNLRTIVGQLEDRVEYIVANEPTKHSDIFFIGLPSDQAVSDVGDFRTLATAWDELEQLVNDQHTRLDQLEESAEKVKRRDLLELIRPFTNWEDELPNQAESLLQDYAKDFNWENTSIRSFLAFDPKEERINNLEQSQTDFHRFLENRQENIEAEKQKINYALTRLQAVRIFDGMLMGFFSSLNFARWENTRNQDN
ncbi:hypothetical protein [uncultured Sunxiuqinia sp.]|uniref:hypothetical protein n=1 Tax=uncultured Sunxiuqinia sp. TaxID=1573825 RepID=UPI0030D71BD7|tara:strand:- start:14868 stop:16136 length:1269 start_codon:yes stop_codon:yes gene_type:complete